ncbi:amidohydrolase [Gammaproteobacteria bacterium LSUCC0057]|jgi:aminocarboxymuconate-semialdehyde decarboxylase|uniref:Amidohydrolase n=1 Tax=Gammaproteobacteria bacterium LSUCC0057 TaxID=2559237 RepID=A0A4Y8UFZ2_9GAMM|nr:amidohydrolase [Gammaproteobacteria bacterium LSUCC0057]
MLIDVHAHMITPNMLNCDPFWGPRMTLKGFTVGDFSLGTKQPAASTDAEAEANLLRKMSHQGRRALMAERGVDRLVFSVPSHAFMYWAGDFGNRYAALCNQELSNYCAADPDHFSFWAHANLAEPEAAAKEIHRAITELGAVGVCVGGANFNGLQAYSPELDPVWAVLEKLNAPIMVHGYNQSVWWGEKHTDDKFETTSILGDCYDESLFFWYLICGGALDRFPNLKTYITHAGGMALFQLGRLNELNRGMAPDALNEKPLVDYLANFWFDLDVHSVALRRAVVDLVGVDRLLHGTNFGGAYDFGDPAAGLGLTEQQSEKIRSGNALALLNLAV